MSKIRSASMDCDQCRKNPYDPSSSLSCNHLICKKCLLTDGECKSNCPCCWYDNAKEFINKNKICCVCCRGFQSNDKTFDCGGTHKHCSECYSSGCNLTYFRKIDFSQNLSLTKHLIFDTCRTWEKKFEETEEPEKCVICMDLLDRSDREIGDCGHRFHEECIDQWFESSGKKACPTCGRVYGLVKGLQPESGKMTEQYLSTPLPEFEHANYKYSNKKTIEITYSFPSGTQGPNHPNPGKPYSGTKRIAYLPNNKEGHEIFLLLKRSFNDLQTFTIGKSVTSGQDNTVTWNDIHHKTSMSGGPQNFGYPDPTYLSRVRHELAAKGYK